MNNCVSYLRVSSDHQEAGDGPERQRDVIRAYCARQGYALMAEFFDAGVSGASMDRPRLMAALDFCKANDVRLLLCECADRWGRDLMVSETWLMRFRDAGIRVLAVQGDADLTNNTDAQAVLIRQVLSAVAQNAKTTLVQRMKAARDRKSVALGRRVEGRKRIERGMATKLILRLGQQGMTFAQIALRVLDYDSPRGGEWTAGKVAKEWETQSTDAQKDARRQAKRRIKDGLSPLPKANALRRKSGATAD